MEFKIEIQNLKCPGCINSIKRELFKIDKVISVEVILEESLVIVSTLFALEKIEEKVKDKLIHLGYPPIDINNSFSRKAKSFVSCAIGKYFD